MIISQLGWWHSQWLFHILFPIWKNIISKPPISLYIYICLWYENVWRLAFLGVTNVDPTWPSTVPLISSVFEGCHKMQQDQQQPMWKGTRKWLDCGILWHKKSKGFIFPFWCSTSGDSSSLSLLVECSLTVLASCWELAQSLIPVELELMELELIIFTAVKPSLGDTHLASSRKFYVKKMIQWLPARVTKSFYWTSSD